MLTSPSSLASSTSQKPHTLLLSAILWQLSAAELYTEDVEAQRDLWSSFKRYGEGNVEREGRANRQSARGSPFGSLCAMRNAGVAILIESMTPPSRRDSA
eukprot:scaffold295_cov257-Pinguiococcus_pyrenoidosus.AAC.12